MHRMSNRTEFKSTGEKSTSGDETANGAVATQKRELTARERAAVERLRAADPPFRLKLTADNDYEQWRAIPDHPDEEVGWALVMEALGSTNRDFVRDLLAQMVSASIRAGVVEEDILNSIFQFVVCQKPKDGFEAKLILHMALTDRLTVAMANRSANVGFFRGSNERKRHRVHGEKMLALNTVTGSYSKIARLFMEQLRTLTEYRHAIDGKVTIQHVSVSDGGQAIVGNMLQPERLASAEMSENSPPALTHSPAVPMPAVDGPTRTVVPQRKAPKRNGKVHP